MTETILKAENLTKVYTRGREKIKALNNVSLEIKRGDFAVIQGVSGSGKTTLLQLLGGLDYPSGGNIYFAGKDITKAKNALVKIRQNHIGFVFQSFNLIPTLSAFENVEAALVAAGVYGKKRKERALLLLKQVRL
jgi:putative ABC transport system ATP-binding protein